MVLIAFASSEGSGEPAHPRSLARTFAARSYRQWIKRNLQTESQIPGPSEWLGMRSWNLSWRNAQRHKFAWRGPNYLVPVQSEILLFKCIIKVTILVGVHRGGLLTEKRVIFKVIKTKCRYSKCDISFANFKTKFNAFALASSNLIFVITCTLNYPQIYWNTLTMQHLIQCQFLPEDQKFTNIDNEMDKSDQLACIRYKDQNG